jgi:hydroxyisourate hydrolase
MAGADAGLTARMAEANAAYERRFGRVFLIRAAGRTADEMLAELERRLRNDDEAEVREACEQLAQIAAGRILMTFEQPSSVPPLPGRSIQVTPHLTTHVLDAAAGVPARGIALALATAQGEIVAEAVTDADGRAGLGPEQLATGVYTLRFETGAYFAARGKETFYPFVTVAFRVTDGRHHHVPLLLSPFAYSTYRGS